MAPEPSSRYVCMCIPPIVARQSVSLLSLLGDRSVNAFPRQRIQATVEELLDASFSVRSVSYQRRVCLSIPLSLLGNDSVETFPRQRIIVGGVVFSADLVWRESTLLVLRRTSCSLIFSELDSIIIKMFLDHPWVKPGSSSPRSRNLPLDPADCRQSAISRPI
jgi:hypothetical protein